MPTSFTGSRRLPCRRPYLPARNDLIGSARPDFHDIAMASLQLGCDQAFGGKRFDEHRSGRSGIFDAELMPPRLHGPDLQRLVDGHMAQLLAVHEAGVDLVRNATFAGDFRADDFRLRRAWPPPAPRSESALSLRRGRARPRRFVSRPRTVSGAAGKRDTHAGQPRPRFRGDLRGERPRRHPIAKSEENFPHGGFRDGLPALRTDPFRPFGLGRWAGRDGSANRPGP